jgi:D-xylose transport system permease protein
MTQSTTATALNADGHTSGAPSPGTDAGIVGTLRALAARAGSVLGENTRLVPILAGWVILAVIFQADTGYFLTTRNLSDLIVQSTVTGLIALGLVFVLLIGEIDLSVAANSGFSATVMGSILVVHQMNLAVAMIAAIGVGAIIGAIQGAWCNLFGIPSFVVTLGVSLVLNAGALALVPNQGQISLLGTSVLGLTDNDLTGATLYAILVVSIAAYLAFRLWLLASSRREKLETSLVKIVVLPVATFTVLGILLLIIFQRSGGLPIAVGIFFALVALASLMLRYSRIGIAMYAVGGNKAAARRSGIKVDRVRVLAFALAGALASFGGIVSAARILGVTTTLGGGSLLLDSIAAAVIGGMSLFGGHGRAAAAILGAIIVETVANGLNLMNAGPAVVYAATGGLLVLAVSIDGLVGRRNQKGARR